MQRELTPGDPGREAMDTQVMRAAFELGNKMARLVADLTLAAAGGFGSPTAVDTASNQLLDLNREWRAALLAAANISAEQWERFSHEQLVG